MNNAHKALDILQLAKQYNCHLEFSPPDKIHYSSMQQPPDHLLLEIKLNKPVLIEYLKHTNRDLSVLVQRAYEGYHYCFNQMCSEAGRKNIPSSFIRVSVVYWRTTVKPVLKVNDAELAIIERLLIQDKRLKYMDSMNTLLITVAQDDQCYLLDGDSGTDFVNWLDMPRGFIFC